jgi:uncharacterized protein DUF1360
MMSDRGLQDAGPFAGHSPDRNRPLASYGILTGTFLAACGGFAEWVRRSGRELPERPGTGDLVLITVATHKVARLIAKDRVSSIVRAPFTQYEDDMTAGEVSESARGSGLRRAIGELLLCPYCLGLWISAAFAGGLIVAPRATRWVAGVFSTLFGADMLQIAYKKAEDTL